MAPLVTCTWFLTIPPRPQRGGVQKSCLEPSRTISTLKNKKLKHYTFQTTKPWRPILSLGKSGSKSLWEMELKADANNFVKSMHLQDLQARISQICYTQISLSANSFLMSFLKYSVGCTSPTVNTSLRFNFPEQDFFPPWNKRQRPHCLYTEAIAWPYTSVNWRRASSCLLPGSLYMGNLWCNARSLTTDTEKSKVDVH